jgi:peptidyl-prolyl cis-trans isomerase D
MLQSIRDNAQGWLAWVIVGLISIPFALWGIHEYLGPNADTAVAKVNGQELSQQEFTEHYRRMLRQVRNFQPDREIDEAKLKQSTLDQLIEDELMVQTSVNHGLRVGDALLAARIHAFPFFQEEGRFSEALYQQALQAQGLPALAFEEQMRRSLLNDQLRNGIQQSALLSSADAAALDRLQEQQRQISYLLIPAEKFAGQIEVGEEDIGQYFEAHKSEFFTPEKVSIDYVELSDADLAAKLSVDEAMLQARYEEQKAHFTTQPEWHAAHILIKSETDEAAAKKQAEELAQRARAGEDFTELAKQFSADTGSAPNGGDLGFFSPGAMVKPFEDAVAAMQPGEISAPVQSRFGYHVIKLIEAKPARTREFEEVREELRETLQAELADTEFYNQQENFSNLAFEHPDNLMCWRKTWAWKRKAPICSAATSSNPASWNIRRCWPPPSVPRCGKKAATAKSSRLANGICWCCASNSTKRLNRWRWKRSRNRLPPA